MVCIEICRWETKESSGLQSMGLQRVGCDCYWECTGTHTHTIIAPKSFVSHLHISCEGFAPWEIAKFWTKPDAEENFNSLTEELPPNGHPRWRSGKESACQSRRHKRHRFDTWGRKIPWRRKWQPIPIFFPGKLHGQRRLVGYSTRDHKRPHGFPIEQNPHKQFVVNRQIFFVILGIIYQGSRWHGHWGEGIVLRTGKLRILGKVGILKHNTY